MTTHNEQPEAPNIPTQQQLQQQQQQHQQKEDTISPTPSEYESEDEDGGGGHWQKDLSSLLTPQTTDEQAQIRRRKRNREAARRSRLRQKERENQLLLKQSQLSQRLYALQKELVEWKLINNNNSNSSNVLIDSREGDDALVDNINSVYALTMETLKIIGELQLQLDDITKELEQLINLNS